MDFSEALKGLKAGKLMARRGWNGKGMAVAYRNGYPDGVPANADTAKAWGVQEGTPFKCYPYLQMRCANGMYQMWLASQTDILAEDWEETK